MKTLAVLTALALTSPTVAAQTIWYVDASASSPGTGTAVDPFRSLQFAIDAPTTAAGDTLDIASGLYLEALDLRGKALKLIGDPAAPPVLHAGGAGSVLRIATGEAPGTELRHLVLTGGAGSPYFGGVVGGAVFMDSTAARFVDCAFEGNRACTSGGAIQSRFGAVTVEACRFSGNRAGAGGALRVDAGTLTVIDCEFVGNDALTQPGCSTGQQEGGAIHTSNCILACTGTVFRDNYARDAGGALYCSSSQGSGTVELCVFESNGRRQGYPSAATAGAVFAPDHTLRSCQFIDNHARGNGGAAARGTYRRCRFEGNTAATGGAVYYARLEECAVFQNHAVDNGGNLSEGGGTHSCENVRSVFWANTSIDGAGACHNSLAIDHCTLIDNLGDPSNTAAQGNGMSNSIVWGNRSIWPLGPANQLSMTSVSYSLTEAVVSGVGNLTGVPLLFGRHVGDAHLLPGSRAIDAADPTSPHDPDGSPADIGALRYDPAHRAEVSVFCVAKTTSLGCVPEIVGIGAVSLAGPPARVEVLNAPLWTFGLALLSASPAQGAFFGGTLCVGGPIVRATTAASLPASGCGDHLSFDLLLPYVAATGVAAGDLLFTQVWFRDVTHPDGTGVGISDALVWTVMP